MSASKKLKICIPCSSGGHLYQLYILKEFWEKHNRLWATFDKEDARSLLKDEPTAWVYHPTNRNIFNLVRNTWLAVKLFWKNRFDVVISSGAAVAVPFFFIGKLFGAKLVYVEVYDRINSPTLTGRLVYPITDLFVVQWEEQKKFYPKGVYIGALL